MTASRATPLPVAPPPMTRMSRGSEAVEAIRADCCAALEGTTALGSETVLRRASREEEGAAPLSLEATGGARRVPAAA